MNGEKKDKVYKLCGSGKKVIQQFWRNAFLTAICGMEIPEETKVQTLTPEQVNGVRAEKYTEALAHLLILFGAGYVDYDILAEMAVDSEKYTDIIFDTENFVIGQAEENTENQTSEEVVRSSFLCAVNSRRYDRIQEVSFSEARRLHGNMRLTVNNGFVFPRSNDFLLFLSEAGEKIAHFNGIELTLLSTETVKNGFGEGKDSISAQLASDDKRYPRLPFLLNIRDAEQIAAIYRKPYDTEFVRFAREKHIPFDNNFTKKYDEYVLKEKLHFVISVTSKKRNVCGDTVCWFDYGATEYQKELIKLGAEHDKTFNIDLKTDILGSGEPTEEKLLEEAVAEFLTNRKINENTVMEITHGENKYLYIFGKDNMREPLDSEEFHNIPFNYNDLWTIIMEWSRSRKIVKRNNEVQIPPEEWKKVKPSERGYAQRLIEEQYFNHKEGNVMLQSLSQLRSYAEANTDKKLSVEKGKNKVKDMINAKKEGSGNEDTGS